MAEHSGEVRGGTSPGAGTPGSGVRSRWPRPRVLEVALDRAGSANALDPAMVAALDAALEEAEARGARRMVLVSRSERVFAAGVDLRFAGSASDAQVIEFFLRLGRLLERIRCAPFTTVCLVEGAAVGAGADLAMACDLRVAGARASFRFPGRAFGLRLGGNRLAHLTSAELAEEIQASGRRIDASEAAGNGMTTHRLASTDPDPLRFVIELDGDRPKLPGEIDHDALGRLADSLLDAPPISARIADYAATALPATAPRTSKESTP